MKRFVCRWKCLILALALVAVASCRAPADPPGAAPSASGASSAQATPSGAVAPATPSAAPARAPARGLLFKATAGQAVVYLLGSIHVARTDLYPLDARIDRAFAASDTLVLELDLTQVNLVSASMKMAQLAQYPPGDSLDKHVDAKTLANLERQAPGGLMSASTLRRFQPWFVGMTVLAAKLEKLGYEHEQGLDSHFAERAKKQKTIIGLETIDEQLGLFSRIPPPVQTLMLEETLAEVERLEPMMKGLTDAWRTGNAQAIEKELIAPLRTKEYRPVFDVLLAERNRRWVTELEQYLKTSRTYFVVVGAAHLIGEESVIDLLRKRKYDVVEY